MRYCAGIPQAKAVNVVHSQVAAQVRNLIIAACAGERSKDSTSNLVSLLKRALLLKYWLPTRVTLILSANLIPELYVTRSADTRSLTSVSDWI